MMKKKKKTWKKGSLMECDATIKEMWGSFVNNFGTTAININTNPIPGQRINSINLVNVFLCNMVNLFCIVNIMPFVILLFSL